MRVKNKKGKIYDRLPYKCLNCGYDCSYGRPCLKCGKLGFKIKRTAL